MRSPANAWKHAIFFNLILPEQGWAMNLVLTYTDIKKKKKKNRHLAFPTHYVDFIIQS